MEDKKILTNEEVLERAKANGLNDEDLMKISGGTGKVEWAWTPVYKIKVWGCSGEVYFIFQENDKVKLWEFFGGGEDGTVVRTEVEYSGSDGGWIDVYYVQTEDKLYKCKRDVIVYQD